MAALDAQQLIDLERSVVEADAKAVRSVQGAVVLDALAEIARVVRDYDWERSLFTHSSGAVGRDAAHKLERLAGLKSVE